MNSFGNSVDTFPERDIPKIARRFNAVIVDSQDLSRDRTAEPERGLPCGLRLAMFSQRPAIAKHSGIAIMAA